MKLDDVAPLSPADVPVASDIAGLARLKNAARADTPEALAAVARQFEALFLDMMLESMREASLGDGIFDSETGDLYQGMFDKQVALDLSRGKGLGIAEMLIRQLSPRGALQPGANAEGLKLDGVKPQGLPFDGATPATRGREQAATSPDWARSPADFVREVLPHARAAAKELGVNPLGLVAQAALETGWGKRVIVREDGASSCNLFGIKAGSEWQGTRAGASTIEFEGDVAGGGTAIAGGGTAIAGGGTAIAGGRSVVPVLRRESFRSYGSIAESFADYVNLLRDSPRYREVLEAGGDVTRFAESMGRSGYATDPAYAEKLKGLLDSDTLRGALAALKNPEGQPI